MKIAKYTPESLAYLNNNYFGQDVEIVKAALHELIDNGFDREAFEAKNHIKIIEVD
jgi:hypothetical protein